MKYLVVLSTFKDKDEARRVSKELIKDKLAACINLIDKVESIYEWEGDVEESSETLAVIKTKTEKFEDLRKKIKELHSYEVPEIVALEVKKGDFDYLDWIDRVLLAE